MNRRSFLRGAGLLLTAPAIVRAASLMPVSVWREPLTWDFLETQRVVSWKLISAVESRNDAFAARIEGAVFDALMFGEVGGFQGLRFVDG